MLFAKARKIKKLTAKVHELEDKIRVLEDEKKYLDDLNDRHHKQISRLQEGLNKCAPFMDAEVFFEIFTDAINVAYD